MVTVKKIKILNKVRLIERFEFESTVLFYMHSLALT